MAETAYGKLIAADGGSFSFQEEAFLAYLKQVKQLYDSGAASADSVGIRNQAFSPMSMSEPMELATLPGVIGDGSSEVLYPPGSGQDGGFPFASEQAFALNERSEVKQAAWTFMKYLLSEEMQSSPAMSGFPVHQGAVRTKLEQFAQRQKEGGAQMMIQGKDGSTQSLTLTEEQTDSVLELLPSAGSYNRSDMQVIGMIKEESAAYFSGSKSAEAVAKAVAGKVNTYLNE